MSGFLGAVNQVTGLVQQGVGAVNDIARLGQSFGAFGGAADSSGASWADGSWWQQLQPGSWRGVPFVLDVAGNKTGRRTVVHEYPYRDSVWVEDLGEGPRRIGLQVFLTGDDVYQQRDALVRACDQPGPGTLVHPTMGSMQCVCVDFDTTDRRDRGRYIEATLAFVLAGDVLFPSASIATGQNVLACADAIMPAAAGDLRRAITSMPVLPGIGPAVASISQFSGMALSAVNDATRALRSVAGVAGVFGRYVGGRGANPFSTVSAAISAATTTRNNVVSAANSLISLGSRL